MELPDGHPVLEDDAGARQRQHRRAQAVERHAALRDAPRRADGRGRLPGRHRQPRDRWRRRGRRCDRREPGRPGDQLHREHRDRQADRGARRPAPEAGEPGARRQERDRRPGGRRLRPGGRWHRSVGLRARPASAARRRCGSSTGRSWIRSWSGSRRGPGALRPASAASRRSTSAARERTGAGYKVAAYIDVGWAQTANSPSAPAGDRRRPRARSLLRADDLLRHPPDGSPRPGGDLRAGPVGRFRRRLSRGGHRPEPDSATVCPLVELSPATPTRPSWRCADFETGIVYVNAGTTGARPPAVRRGTRDTGTGIAKPATPRSTPPPSGSPPTSTSAGSSAPRSDNQSIELSNRS